MNLIEWKDDSYRVECPVCKQRIQSETAEGDFEGGFVACEHLHFSFHEGWGIIHPQPYHDMAHIESQLLLAKIRIARDRHEKDKGAWTVEEYLDDITQDEAVEYYAMHPEAGMVSYCLKVPAGGCGGSRRKVNNLFVFKTS